MIAALPAACLMLLAHAYGGADLAALERAIASDPENLRLAADYRQAAIATSSFDRSIDFFEKLARRKDAGANVQISLALAYVDKVPAAGEIRRLYLGRDALGALTKAIERQPTVLAYYLRGVINLYYNNLIFKRIPRGLDDLRQAVALIAPDTPSALAARVHVSMGDGYWRLDDRNRAREIWSAALARYPDTGELKRRLDPDAEKVRWVVLDALNTSTRVDTSLRGLLSP